LDNADVFGFLSNDCEGKREVSDKKPPYQVEGCRWKAHLPCGLEEGSAARLKRIGSELSHGVVRGGNLKIGTSDWQVVQQ
jgi:hypothetical protein